MTLFLQVGRLCVQCLVLCVLTLITVPSALADIPPAPHTVDAIVAAFHCDYPPVSFWDKNTDRPSGFFVDVMQGVARRSGLQVNYICKNSWPELVASVESGEAGVAVLLKSAEREKKLLFSTPIDVTYLSFFARSQSALDADTRPESQIVGAIAGSMSWEQLRNRPGIRLRTVGNYQEGIFSLLAGEIDLFAGEESMILKRARETRLDDRIKRVGKPFVERERCFAVNRENHALLERLNKVLPDFIASPEYHDIYLKWYGTPTAFWTGRRMLAAGGFVLIIVVCGMAFWRYRSLSNINKHLVLEIAERKKAERSLELFKNLVNKSGEAIFVNDPRTGRFIDMNDKACAMTGYDRTELLAMGVPNIETKFPGDAEWQHHVEELRQHGSVLVVGQFRRKDGTVFPVETNVSIVKLGTREYMIAVVRDITERKRDEEKIRQNEQFIRNILDTVDEGFLVLNRDYRILTANSAYCAQAGRTCDEVIGRYCYEISHLSSRPCHEQNEDCAVSRVFITGEPQKSVHKHRDQDGHTVYVETKAFPIKNPAGGVISVIETVNNITERHMLEEERLKSQKLESIGTLAGGIAHDFNNLLQGVFGYISLAKITHADKEKSLSMLEQAEKALHQSVNLTTQLLTFSKGGKPLKKPADLRSVIENAARFALSGSRSDYRLDIDPRLWPADVDAGQIGQVIQNIVLNADQAMPSGGGSVVVTAANVAEGSSLLPRCLARGRYISIAIRDSGVGIPPQHIGRIFDPYFTTKEHGSGLGLATSYSIIKNHGGIIDVASKPGNGSVFTVYLPAHEQPGRTEPEAAMKLDASSQRRARVLIMDDEDLVRHLCMEMLKSLGHEAEVAQHGQEAIEKYQAAMPAGKPFDIVILDLTVRGGMGGADTLKKLLEIDPAVKAVVSTGYSDDAAIANHLSLGFKAYLKKPYDITALRDTLYSLHA